jgi:hypothetical protein
MAGPGPASGIPLRRTAADPTSSARDVPGEPETTCMRSPVAGNRSDFHRDPLRPSSRTGTRSTRQERFPRGKQSDIEPSGGEPDRDTRTIPGSGMKSGFRTPRIPSAGAYPVFRRCLVHRKFKTSTLEGYPPGDGKRAGLSGLLLRSTTLPETTASSAFISRHYV